MMFRLYWAHRLDPVVRILVAQSIRGRKPEVTARLFAEIIRQRQHECPDDYHPLVVEYE